MYIQTDRQKDRYEPVLVKDPVEDLSDEVSLSTKTEQNKSRQGNTSFTSPAELLWRDCPKPLAHDFLHTNVSSL